MSDENDRCFLYYLKYLRNYDTKNVSQLFSNLIRIFFFNIPKNIVHVSRISLKFYLQFPRNLDTQHFLKPYVSFYKSAVRTLKNKSQEKISLNKIFDGESVNGRRKHCGQCQKCLYLYFPVFYSSHLKKSFLYVCY